MAKVKWANVLDSDAIRPSVGDRLVAFSSAASISTLLSSDSYEAKTPAMPHTWILAYRPSSAAGTVRARILKSSHSDQRSM